MNDIEKLGTVIRARQNTILPNRQSVWVFNGNCWSNNEGYFASIEALTDITVLHEGYTPPMEEPAIGTVVMDKNGGYFYVKYPGKWYTPGLLDSFTWKEIANMDYEIIWPKQDSE